MVKKRLKKQETWATEARHINAWTSKCQSWTLQPFVKLWPRLQRLFLIFFIANMMVLEQHWMRWCRNSGFLTKFEDIARNRDDAVALLQQRVIQIAAKRAFMRPYTCCSSSSSGLANDVDTFIAASNHFSGNTCCEACCCIDCKI